MGREVRFHALPQDLAEFVEFATTRDPVVITLRDSDEPRIDPIEDPNSEINAMMLLNREVLPAVQRELVTHPGGSDYYRIPYSLPVLELFPSRMATWNQHSALLRGRLYGFSFDSAPDAYGRWYGRLRNWICSHFARNPVIQLDGYVGRTALEWFQRGGIFLPWPTPPATPEWESFVTAQEPLRAKEG